MYCGLIATCSEISERCCGKGKDYYSAICITQYIWKIMINMHVAIS